MIVNQVLQGKTTMQDNLFPHLSWKIIGYDDVMVYFEDDRPSSVRQVMEWVREGRMALI